MTWTFVRNSLTAFDHLHSKPFLENSFWMVCPYRWTVSFWDSSLVKFANDGGDAWIKWFRAQANETERCGWSINTGAGFKISEFFRRFGVPNSVPAPNFFVNSLVSAHLQLPYVAILCSCAFSGFPVGIFLIFGSFSRDGVNLHFQTTDSSLGQEGSLCAVHWVFSSD